MGKNLKKIKRTAILKGPEPMKNSMARCLILIAALSSASSAVAGLNDSPRVSPGQPRRIFWNPANPPLGKLPWQAGHPHPASSLVEDRFSGIKSEWLTPMNPVSVSILGRPLALDFTRGALGDEFPNRSPLSAAPDNSSKPWNRHGPAAPRIQFRVSW